MEEEATYKNQAPYYAAKGLMPSTDPRRTVKLMDTEYELAQAVMDVVKTYLELHPEIDTCKVSRLCEMMLVYV
jgi:hypothetical protein